MDATFLRQRRALYRAAQAALEQPLTASGVPPLASGLRRIDHVLLDGLLTDQVRPALDDVAEGAGGELRGAAPSFASTESSAALAVNTFAAFVGRSHRDGLLGIKISSPRFERPFRVAGVRAPTPPTLDVALLDTDQAVLIESKFLEPWRDERTTTISAQYDRPARNVSAGTAEAVEAVRTGASDYSVLGAAQLLKHLLGIHSAIASGALPSRCRLILAYWEPLDSGPHQPLLDRLMAEVRHLTDRLADQPVSLSAVSYLDLWREWSQPGCPGWLQQHAARLMDRYAIRLGVSQQV